MSELNYYIAPLNHCTSGFNLGHRLQKWNPVPMPMTWNITTRSFEYTNIYKRKYIAWYFCIWVVICLTVIGCSLDVILHINSAGLPLAVICFGWIGFSYVVWAPARLLCVHWTSIVRGFECYNQLTDRLDKTYPIVAKQFQTDNGWKLMSVALRCVIAIFCGIPFVLVPAVFITEMDPFIYTFPKVLCKDTSQCSVEILSVIHALRLLFLYIAILEACRFYSIFFPLFLYLFERQAHCLFVLGKIPLLQCPQSGLAFFRWYSTLRVADRINIDGFCALAGVALGGAFGVWVGVNVITLKCYNILPISVYWLMPTSSLIIFVLAALILSEVVKSRVESLAQLFLVKRLLAEDQHKIKRKWLNMKLIERKLKSCRPLQLKCGNFFTFKEEIKITFFYDVFMRTIDGSMMPIFD